MCEPTLPKNQKCNKRYSIVRVHSVQIYTTSNDDRLATIAGNTSTVNVTPAPVNLALPAGAFPYAAVVHLSTAEKRFRVPGTGLCERWSSRPRPSALPREFSKLVGRGILRNLSSCAVCCAGFRIRTSHCVFRARC